SAGYAGSASTPLAQGVLNGSATALSSSAATAVSGQAVTFTATVSPAPASLSVPTGTVTFVIDGVTQPGAASLNASRQASITLSNLTVGSHTVRALYSGDANFAAGSSAVLTQTVNKASISTTVSSNVSTAVYGQTVVLYGAAWVYQPGSGTPT